MRWWNRCWWVRGSALALMLASAPAAARAESETAVVPLHLVPIAGDQLKVGIEISLAGGEPRLYTFDTGSSGFYAASNPVWWPSFTPVNGAPIKQMYGDGAIFESVPVRTSVGILTTEGVLEAEVEMAKIDDAYGGPLGPQSESTWLDDVAAGRPPLFGKFFGDFGSGLREAKGLFAVLPQLPGNLSSGFVVSLGCRGSAEAFLFLGLTEEMRARVTSWVPMLGAGEAPPFPGGRPTYAQQLIAGDFLIRRGATSYDFSTDAILDTGAPTTSIHEGKDLEVPDALLEKSRTRVRPGSVFRVAADGSDDDDGFELGLITGHVPGRNEINVKKKDRMDDGDEPDDGPLVNLGLIPFLRHDVMFDVERGLVGFAPCRSGGLPQFPVRSGSGILPRY